jgi:hypothetical protein
LEAEGEVVVVAEEASVVAEEAEEGGKTRGHLSRWVGVSGSHCQVRGLLWGSNQFSNELLVAVG